MVREELGLQKSGLVIDSSKNGKGASAGAPASFLLICRKWAIVLWQSICIFQIHKRFLAGAAAGLCLWCVPEARR